MIRLALVLTVACKPAATPGTLPTPPEPNTPLEPPSDSPSDDSGAVEAGVCTQVIGYSQVGQARGGWYTTSGVFESRVDDDRWQLLWNSGAGVDRWQDPDYAGWSRPIQSPCAESSDAPDRVLLSVSGPYGDDEDAWADAIRASVATIRAKLPSVSDIVLQPVVGGPDHEGCPDGDGLVRASWQHAHIDAAIARVVGGDVQAGASPEVRDCADYRDSVGHLTVEAAEAVAGELGDVYGP